VVSTSLGAEGLPVTPGTDLLIADAPQDFARAVIQLLEDAGLRARLANAAYGLVQERFRAEIVARQFEGVCQEMV
jgi:glycosyltransferase involved in cell wall biosynthesis